MLVPNVKLMSEAIEAHVMKHTQKIKDTTIAEAETERLQENLISQVLKKLVSKYRLTVKIERKAVLKNKGESR